MSAPAPKKRLFLVDGANLAYRSYFAFVNAPLTNARGLNTSAPYGFTQTLLKLLQDERPDHVAIVWDPEGPSARHIRFPDYKATRQKMPDEMEESLPYIDRLVAGFQVAAICVEGWEADDIIGTLAVQGADQGLDVYILSSDKDFLQLVRPNLRLFNIRKGFADLEILGPAETEAKWGVPPSGIREVLALMGDSSDNVPGVPGVGEKTAVELVKEYGTLENVIANAEKIKRKNVRESLIANQEQAKLSKELVTIDVKAPVTLDLAALERRDPDPEQLLPLFLELEFVQLMSRVAKKRRELPVIYRTVKAPEDLDPLVRALEGASEISLGVETGPGSPFTADVVGLAFSCVEGEAFYVPMLEPGQAGTLFAAPTIDPAWTRAVYERLRPILEDPAKAKGGPDAKRALLVYAAQGITVRGVAFDAMIASYLCDPSQRQHSLEVNALRYLNEKKTPVEELTGKGKSQVSKAELSREALSRFACEEADFALRLARVFRQRIEMLGMERLYREVELPLVPVLAGMERAGVKIDARLLRSLSSEFDAKLALLEKEVHALAGEAFDVDSPKQLATVLFEKLEVHKKLGVRVKRLKTGYSTDQSVLEQLEEHPLVGKIVEYRSLRKLKGTYLDALPPLADRDGLIHTSFHQAVAATGRLSSSDPNLQNIPIRTPEGKRIRGAFVPRAPGRVLLSADYSQIELRVLAHVAEDPVLIETFHAGLDVHRATAARVFGKELAEVTPELRSRAKAINFGIIYGMGAQRLARETGLTLTEADGFIQQYFQKLPGIKSYLEGTIRFCEKHGYVQTLFGRRRLIPEITAYQPGIRAQARNMAVNTPIQGTAADLIKVAMIRIDAALRERNLQSLLILQVHDELVLDVPEVELDAVKALVREKMEGAASDLGGFRVPLQVDMGHGGSWLAAH